MEPVGPPTPTARASNFSGRVQLLFSKLLEGRGHFRLDLLVVLGATATGNIANYMYQVAMGRMLGPVEYGAFGALFTLFYIASVMGNSLQAAVSEAVSRLNVHFGPQHAISTVLGVSLVVAAGTSIIAAAIGVAHNPIGTFLGIDSTGPIIAVAVAIIFALVTPVFVGLFAGLQRFVVFSLVGYIVPQVSKLIVSLALVGMGLVGATAAMSISGAIAVSVAVLWILFAERTRPKISRSIGATLSIPMKSLLLAVLLMVPANVDVLVVAHFFPSYDVGQYNALATLGKILIFAPMPFVLILVPLVTQRHTHGQDTSRPLILNMAGTILLLAPILTVSWLIPEELVRLVIGEEYLPAAAFLPWYGSAMALFAVNVLLAHYYLSVRRTRYLVSAVAISLAEVALIWIVHAWFSQIITILLVGNVLLLVYGTTELIAPLASRHSHRVHSG